MLKKLKNKNKINILYIVKKKKKNEHGPQPEKLLEIYSQYDLIIQHLPTKVH